MRTQRQKRALRARQVRGFFDDAIKAWDTGGVVAPDPPSSAPWLGLPYLLPDDMPPSVATPAANGWPGVPYALPTSTATTAPKTAPPPTKPAPAKAAPAKAAAVVHADPTHVDPDWGDWRTWGGTQWGVAAVGALGALYGASRLIVTRRGRQ